MRGTESGILDHQPIHFGGKGVGCKFATIEADMILIVS